MGVDMPEDGFYMYERNKHYGWPYCYEYQAKVYDDTTSIWSREVGACEAAPSSYVWLGAHVAPLGFEYFAGFDDPALNNYFLMALHGSGKVSLARGYSIDRFRKGGEREPFITGFLQDGERYGRPCDIHIKNTRSFFFTDDYSGIVYYVEKRSP